MKNIEGKIAVVTGASEGIGRAVALAMAKEGALLALAARTEKRLLKVISNIKRKDGIALGIPTDVTDPNQVNSLFERTLEQYGHIDILINNVGKGLRKLFIETTNEDWDQLVAENLSSVVYCCRAVIPYMQKQKSGKIINIASRSGRIGESGLAAYSAVKHGVVGLSKALAEEEQKNGISVNVISPGPVSTERMAKILPDVDKTTWLTPEEVAMAVLFLLSAPCKNMQGRSIDLF